VYTVNGKAFKDTDQSSDMKIETLIRLWLSRDEKLIKMGLTEMSDDIRKYITNIAVHESLIKPFMIKNVAGRSLAYTKAKNLKTLVRVGKSVILWTKLEIALKTGDFSEGDVILSVIYPKIYKRVQREIEWP